MPFNFRKHLTDIKKVILRNKGTVAISFTYFASIASIMSFYFGVFGKLEDEGKIGLILLGILAIIILGDNIYHRWVYKKRSNEIIRGLNASYKEIASFYIPTERNANYAKALGSLNNGFNEIHSLIRWPVKVDDHVKSSFKELSLISFDRKSMLHALEHFCTNLSSTFETITGSSCATCIKIMGGESSNPVVITLARDTKSKQRRSGKDKSDTKDYVLQNTDFASIFTNKNPALPKIFFQNNLVKLEYYENTSFKDYGYPPNTDYESRLKGWTLPYKSTIVTPIIPHNQNENDYPLKGFLCVDSKEIDIFAKKYDVELLQGVADGIYNIIHLYTLLKN